MVTFPFIRFRRDIVETGTQVSKYKLSLSNELNQNHCCVLNLFNAKLCGMRIKKIIEFYDTVFEIFMRHFRDIVFTKVIPAVRSLFIAWRSTFLYFN